jgi:hypothetical protein
MLFFSTKYIWSIGKRVFANEATFQVYPHLFLNWELELILRQIVLTFIPNYSTTTKY